MLDFSSDFFYFPISVLADVMLMILDFQVIQTSDTNKLVRGLEILKRLQIQIEHCRVETSL